MSNPYTPSVSRLFYGREQIMRDILQDEEAAQTVIFIGGRRCGKTRLLERLRDYLHDVAGSDSASAWLKAAPDSAAVGPERKMRPHWPFLVNFQGLAFDSLKEALVHVANSIAEHPSPGGPLPPIPKAEEFGTQALENWLHQVDAGLGQAGLGGLALLIDEIAELFGKPWHHDLMAFLRRLGDFSLKSRVWIVLAGSYALDGYRHLDGSPPLNTARRIFLRDLGYSARRRMAIEPFSSAGQLPPHDEVLRDVDRAAAGNVWLLTLVLESLFSRGATIEVLRETEESLLEQQNDLFERWAKALDEGGWKLYSRIAAGGKLQSVYLRNAMDRAAKSILEYQSLAHRTPNGEIEMGPELFRRWAEEAGKISPPFVTRPAPQPESGILPPGHFSYEVALSYASPQRETARHLADQLRRLGMRVFYDQELMHEIWGTDLQKSLPAAYDRQARVTVLLLSHDYVERRWPQVEAAAALAKALREGWDAVLQVSLDGARLPDMSDSVVYMDISGGDIGIADVALNLAARLKPTPRESSDGQ